MTTLTVTATHNFTGENLGANPIDQIQFTNPSQALATFGSNQFGSGNGLIADSVLIAGNGSVNEIQVLLSAAGTFSAAAWQFAGWNPPSDFISISGTSGADTITGTDKADIVVGGGGADSLDGGAGDDLILAGNLHISTGEQIDGGAGNDTLEVSGINDLSAAGTSVVNVETLKLWGTGTTLTASGTQFGGAGDFTAITSDNTANNQTLFVSGNSVDLSGVSFINWGGANQTIDINATNAAVNLLTGSSQKDNINGIGNSADAMHGGGGADTLNGGNGDDIFDYSAAGEVVSGEVISGGGGTDKIQLQNAGSNDFSLATITGIETLDFVNGTSIGTFSGAQLGAGLIATIDGGSGTDALIVNGSSVDLSGVSFTNWTDGTDTITINGTTSGETLTGSSRNDVINGGRGPDTLIGSNGDDTFSYAAGNEAAPGEVIDGGGGTGDRILVIDTGLIIFSGLTVSGIERLEYSGGGAATVGLDSSQLGGAGINRVIGSSGTNAIFILNANNADLSAVAFNSWTDGTDTITISGTGAADSLLGSDHADIITGGQGADTLNGGGGNDVFRYTATGDVASGESVSGGGGTDTLEITGGNHDFSAGVALTSIEAVRFTGTGSAAFSGDDIIGGGTSGIATITGSAGADSFVVNGAFFTSFSGSLSTVAFTNWTDGTDTITINGLSTPDAIVGSNHADFINGFDGTDTMTGGAGNDVLDGGANTDKAVYFGTRAQYRIDQLGSGDLQVVDLRPGAPDGTDTVRNVENFTFSDGTFAANAVINQAPVITSNGGGSTATVSIAENSTAVTTVTATDTDPGTTLVFSIAGGADAARFKISAATGALAFIAAPDFEGATDSDGNNSYVVQVSVTDGGLSDKQTITVSITDVNEQQSPNPVTDPTSAPSPGSALFDAPFYLSHNPDVAAAGVDPLTHYNTFGLHEGRDPDALFDTSFYLAVNRDVFVSGANPLDQFHQTGWKQGRDPGPNFDTTLYLLHNPDVAAAHVDPLEHFLKYGQFEDRQAYAAIGTAVNGFDAEYYILHNPDVAAAGVDPLAHFNTSGFHEGRNPNAYFDTAGYLSHYADVAAAGVNPLQHYEQLGWKEGRDPSAGFDTLGYLAANPDVAAAGANPLDHFLNSGIYEGRAVVNDGVFH